MNIFFRDFKASSPVTTGAEWLAALTARIAIALLHALPYGRLTSPQVWVLSLLFAAWLATSIMPVTAGLAAVVNAVLLGIGALKLLEQLPELGRSLVAGLRAAYNAKSDANLAAAGALLGRALDEYALNALSVFVNERTFETIQDAILSRFPVPDWFASAYEKNLYFRDFNPAEPVSSGARWLAAATARISVAFVDALGYANVKQELFASARSLWLLALILAGWFALSVIPATAGLANAVNAILVGIGLIALADRAAEIGKALEAGLRGAYEASNEAELDTAARALAPALTGAVVTLIEVLITHQAFRAAEAASLRRFPMPEWFRGRVEQAAKRRGRARPSEVAPKPAEGTTRTPEASEPMRPEPEQRTAGQGRRALERAKRTAKGTVALAGARKAAGELDRVDWTAVGLAVGLGAVVVGAGVTIAVVSGRKR